MTELTNRCRATFEKWFFAVYKVHPYCNADGTYANSIFNTRWLAWQEGWHYAKMDYTCEYRDNGD